LVNINRLVETSIKILRLLLDKSLHYNEIIRQTSPDRTHVDNAIYVLERGQLIMEYKISKRERKQQKIHSQTKIMQITDLGRELIDILVSLEQYKKAYYELKKPVDEYFTNWIEKKHSISQFKTKSLDQRDAIRNNTLRERGFTHKDLEFYDSSGVGTTLVLRALEGKILEVITVRCALMLYRFSITDIAKDILNNILVSAVTFRVLYLIENIHRVGSNIDLYRGQIAEDLMYEIGGNYYFPALIHKEVKNAILSYLSLLKPPKEDVENAYKEIKSNLKLLSSEELKKDEERLICLLDAYEAFMSKSG
jgi:DNA-binding HxlR family transcriptional regulator